jgi:hypothetical protein
MLCNSNASRDCSCCVRTVIVVSTGQLLSMRDWTLMNSSRTRVYKLLFLGMVVTNRVRYNFTSSSVSIFVRLLDLLAVINGM